MMPVANVTDSYSPKNLNTLNQARLLTVVWFFFQNMNLYAEFAGKTVPASKSGEPNKYQVSLHEINTISNEQKSFSNIHLYLKCTKGG